MGGVARGGRQSARSPAIGQRIEAVRYDAESGYVVVLLDSRDELWVAACYEEGYHLFTVSPSLLDTENR